METPPLSDSDDSVAEVANTAAAIDRLSDNRLAMGWHQHETVLQMEAARGRMAHPEVSPKQTRMLIDVLMEGVNALPIDAPTDRFLWHGTGDCALTDRLRSRIDTADLGHYMRTVPITDGIRSVRVEFVRLDSGRTAAATIDEPDQGPAAHGVRYINRLVPWLVCTGVQLVPLTGAAVQPAQMGLLRRVPFRLEASTPGRGMELFCRLQLELALLHLRWAVVCDAGGTRWVVRTDQPTQLAVLGYLRDRVLKVHTRAVLDRAGVCLGEFASYMRRSVLFSIIGKRGTLGLDDRREVTDAVSIFRHANQMPPCYLTKPAKINLKRATIALFNSCTERQKVRLRQTTPTPTHFERQFILDARWAERICSRSGKNLTGWPEAERARLVRRICRDYYHRVHVPYIFRRMIRVPSSRYINHAKAFLSHKLGIVPARIAPAIAESTGLTTQGIAMVESTTD